MTCIFYTRIQQIQQMNATIIKTKKYQEHNDCRMHDGLVPCIMESKVTSLIAAHSLLSQFTMVTVTALVESMLCCLPLEEFDLQYTSLHFNAESKFNY